MAISYKTNWTGIEDKYKPDASTNGYSGDLKTQIRGDFANTFRNTFGELQGSAVTDDQWDEFTRNSWWWNNRFNTNSTVFDQKGDRYRDAIYDWVNAEQKAGNTTFGTFSGGMAPAQTQTPAPTQTQTQTPTPTPTQTQAQTQAQTPTSDPDPQPSGGDGLLNQDQNLDWANQDLAGINKLYNDLLGRNAKPEGLQYWAEQLAKGYSLNDLAYAIMQAPEYADRQVNNPAPPPAPPQTSFTPERSSAQQARPQNREVTPEETSQFQLQQILESDSPLMRQAALRGRQQAAQRGLLNSSLASEASQAAMIAAARDFALNDSNIFANTASENMGANNTAELSNSQLVTNNNQFNAGQFNNISLTVTEAAKDRAQQLLLQDRDLDFRGTEAELDRALQKLLQENQQEFQGTEAELDRLQQLLLQDNQFSFEDTAREDQQEFENDNREDTQDFVAGQAELDRQQQLALQTIDQSFQLKFQANNFTFEQWRQNDSQAFTEAMALVDYDWRSIEAQLDRELEESRIDASAKNALMANVLSGMSSILADPNLDVASKRTAIETLFNSTIDLTDIMESFEVVDGQIEFNPPEPVEGVADPQDPTAGMTPWGNTGLFYDQSTNQLVDSQGNVVSTDPFASGGNGLINLSPDAIAALQQFNP